MSAMCKQEEATSTLTPLQIPPRPSTLQETPTSQTLTSHIENPQILPETLSQENPQIPTETLAPASPHTVAKEITQEEKAEETGVVEKESSEEMVVEEEGSDGGVVREEAMGTGQDVVKTWEGEGDDKDDAEIPGEGSEPEKASVAEITGAGDGNPEEVIEGEIRVVVEEGTSVEVTADQIVEKDLSKGDKVEEEMVTTPCIEEETEVRDEEKEVEAEIVVIDDVPSDDMGTPTDERTARITTRRSKMLEELAEPPQPRELQFRALQGECQVEDGDSETEEKPVADVDLSQAEEKRLAAERKRKGKLEAKALTKIHRPDSSTLAIKESMLEAIRVPCCKGIRGAECR